MNIGIVTTWFERGAAYVSRVYFNVLSKKRNVYIYARGGERFAIGDPKWDKDYVTWGKRVNGGGPTAVDRKDFSRWMAQNDIKVLIFNEQQSWDVILETLLLKGILIGAYVDYYTPETVPFFRLYDFLLCNTKRHYSVFKDHPQAFYIPWGTDVDVFRPRDRVARADTVTFFHSSGVSPLRKGTDILVRAFQHVSGNARLIIHSQGTFHQHPPTASIVAQDPRVELIETEAGAPGLYYLGDVYVYPTRLEGIGLTIAEALSSGLPVITTKAPPMNEFVVHGLNGRLVEVERHQRRFDNYYWPQSICNEAALTKAMQFYVNNIHNLRNYKNRAREYALAHLDWRKNSHDLPELIENITRNRERFDRGLVNAVKKYERCRHSRQPFHKRIMRFLSRAGAGRLERLLKGLLNSSLRRDIT